MDSPSRQRFAWFALLGLVVGVAHGQAPVETKSYAPGAVDLEATAARVQAAIVRVDADAEVYSDARTRKLVVRGTAAAQRKAVELLKPPPTPRARAARPMPPPQKRVDGPPNAVRSVAYEEPMPEPSSSRKPTVQEVCDSLASLYGSSLELKRERDGSWNARTRLDGAVAPAFSIDGKTGEVTLAGAPPARRYWWHVVQAVKQGGDPNAGGAQHATVLKLDKADPARVKRAVEVLQAALRKRQFDGDNEEMEEDPAAVPEEPPADPVLGGAMGPVQIEVLDGLDVIVIKGKPQDVARIQKIIEDIERQTMESKPEIEIIELAHVQDRSLATLVNQVYTEIHGVRQGRVTIIALRRPNAILLAGKPENVATAKELIAKLDQPIKGDAEFRVFRLKYLSAADAESTVSRYFQSALNGPGATNQGANANQQGTTPIGLPNQAVVIAESRINGLIVFAGPRDMADVERLINELDVESSASKNKVRIFRLKNALSDDLAKLLQDSIAGQNAGRATGGSSGTNITQGLTTGPGAAAPSGSSQSASRTAGLQLLRVDENGQRLIESGVLGDVQVQSDPRSNSLIVTGPPNTMELIEALIEELDTLAQVDAAIKVFTVVNGDAAALRTTLEQLFGASQAGQGATAQTLATGTPGSDEPSLVSLRFATDERTNSVIVTGGTRDLDTVERILIRLDETDVRRRRTTVYRLRNAPALDVAEALQDFIERQRQINQLQPTLQSPVEQIDREVIVVAEPVSNSLLVSATVRYYDEMRRIVEDLDRRPPLVMVQTLIAEVSLNEFNELGAEFGLQDSLLFRRGINGNTATPGFGFNNSALPTTNASATALSSAGRVGTQGLGSFALGRTNPALGYGGMVLSASSQSVSALVRALQQNSQLQVISRPQIQMQDNQLGRVIVGQTVAYPTGATVTATATQTNTTLKDTGIILEVRPRTSPDGLIVMEVGAERSRLGPEAEGTVISVTANGTIRAPRIEITRAVTVVSARTGQTVILGGLITKNRNNETRRVPYLSDIPVVGNMFRYDQQTEGKTELLIFMTPYIIRTDEDIDFINAQEATRMNWCLADIADAHGQVPGITGEGPWNQRTTPVIYPDDDPTGTIPVEPSPPGDLNTTRLPDYSPTDPQARGPTRKTRRDVGAMTTGSGEVPSVGPVEDAGPVRR